MLTSSQKTLRITTPLYSDHDDCRDEIYRRKAYGKSDQLRSLSVLKCYMK